MWAQYIIIIPLIEGRANIWISALNFRIFTTASSNEYSSNDGSDDRDYEPTPEEVARAQEEEISDYEEEVLQIDDVNQYSENDSDTDDENRWSWLVCGSSWLWQ